MSKRALITGASGGIGQALTKAAIAEGYFVVGQGRNFANTTTLPQHIVELELSDLAEVKRYCQLLRKDKSDFDLVVLNAGFGQFGAIEQFSETQIETLVNTNLTSSLLLLSVLVPKLKAQKRGDIVILGSESALAGAKQGSVYCATKFALRGLAQSLQSECAGTGVRVILVNPGPVRSNFFDDLHFAPADGSEHALEPTDVAQAVFDALALPRSVVVEEINIQPTKRVFVKKPR